MTPAPRAITPHGILVAHLEKLLQQGLPPEVSLPLTEAYALAKGLDPYLNDCTTQASSALTALAEETAQEDWSQRFKDGETLRHLEQEMLSGHLEGQALKMWVQMMQARRILEIGMFTGYSALAMAEGIPEDGEVIACEVDPYVAEFAQRCFQASPHGHKITVKVGPALETLATLAESQVEFDFIFIDADKKEYSDYFTLILDKGLLKPGGVMAVDNTLFQGEAYLSEKPRSLNGEAIAQFNQRVAADPRVDQVLLPLRDGVTLIRYRGKS
jgi:caffeoyl-CoA O-methyltransferase